MLPCLASHLIDQSDGGINLSQFAKESDAIKMRERAKIAENQVMSLPRNLRLGLQGPWVPIMDANPKPSTGTLE